MTLNWTTDVRRRVPWETLEARQRDCVAATRTDAAKAFLLVSEPEPTFTHGRFAGDADKLWDAERLEKEGARTAPVSRGGKWTFHGPGQIVVYPVVQLESLGLRRRDIREFLHRFRAAAGETLRHFGVEAENRDEPFGIYSGGAKLVSFGINVSHGIVSHGLAFYYADQSHFFSGIRPCGVSGERITSLTQLRPGVPPWEVVAEHLASAIKKGLNR